MKNELFSIGPFTVYGYGLMIAIGILLAYLTFEARAVRKNISRDEVFEITIVCLLSGLFGAKLLYWLTRLSDIIRDPSFLIATLTDGFVVLGGIGGGLLGGFIYTRIKKVSFMERFDLAIPSVALAQGFGRIGCFLAGCCYGREVKGWFSVTFKNSEYAPNGVALFPSQLCSAALDFFLYIILISLHRHTDRKGICSGTYLILYGIGRFIMEFFRGDAERGSIGMLSTSQFLCIFVFILGIIITFRAREL